MDRLSDQAVNCLKYVSTATLTTQLFRRRFRNVFMQGVAMLGKLANDKMVGPAFTLRNIPPVCARFASSLLNTSYHASQISG